MEKPEAANPVIPIQWDSGFTKIPCPRKAGYFCVITRHVVSEYRCKIVTDLKRSMIEKNELSKNELLKHVVEGIHEKKGKNINTIELKGISGAVCDYFVICEGNTPTQVSALADSVEKMVLENVGERPLRVHGKQNAEWIGMDYGSVIVHIFLPELRNFYNIDLLWQDARAVRIPSID